MPSLRSRAAQLEPLLAFGQIEPSPRSRAARLEPLLAFGCGCLAFAAEQLSSYPLATWRMLEAKHTKNEAPVATCQQQKHPRPSHE
jgi:hypothetical protein